MRYKEFSDEWIISNISNEFTLLTNNSLSRDDLNYDCGCRKNIHYGDILTKYTTVKNITDNDIPYINDNIKISNSSIKLISGDIIVADTAEDYTVGKAIEIYDLNSLEVYGGLHTIPLRPKHKFAVGYLAYYFNSYNHKKRIFPLIQGIKVYSISKSALSSSIIKYPTLEEQDKIAQILIKIDARISTQKKIINNYKSLINGLIKMYFPNKGLCEVGQTTDLNEILIEGNKISVNTKHYQKITVKLNKEGIAFSNLNREMSDTRPFYLRNHNEIIIGKQNYFNGSIAIIPEEYDNTICSNAIMSFKVKKDYNLKFIYYCISNDLFLKYRSHLANGTGQKELSEKDFLSFKIILPDENTQKKIVNNIEKISEKLQLEKKILFLYEQQKQYLLDKLFI